MQEKSIKELHASKKVTSDFVTALKNATVEKGVENAYWQAVKASFKQGQPNDSDATDGFIDIKYVEAELFLLMEFKYNKHLNKRRNAMEVIIQTIFYMHTMREQMAKVPNMIMIGDKEYAFVMNTTPILKYLDNNDVDWSVSPSSAAAKYRTSMVVDLYNDRDIQYYIHKINDKTFTFNTLLDDIKTLMSDSNQKIKLDPNNINAAFDQFVTMVITDRKRFSAEDLVSIFITVASNRKNHVSNLDGNLIKVNDYSVPVNKQNYRNFINHFEEEYRPSEKRKFTEISDRLIQDLQRRASGEFYTPSAFVNYALSRITKALGNNWNNDFSVWDPAWGTGNLTRDIHIENLFASTIHNSDLIQGYQYNRGARKFIFDFLNDDYDFEENNLFGYKAEKLPAELVNLFTQHPENKFLFFLNPPYGTAGNANSKTTKSKKGISNSKIQEEMKEHHLQVQDQLYAQFLYRIIKMKKAFNLSNVYIALYSPSLFLTGKKFNKFRKLFFDNFKFLEGTLFQASNFADVKGNWAIDFSIWKAGNLDQNKRNVFDHKLIQLDTAGKVTIAGNKKLWNTDNKNTKSLQKYLNENTEDKSQLTKRKLVFRSRYVTSNKFFDRPQNAIGYIINDTNNIEASAKGVYLMSSTVTRHIKTSIITANTLPKQMIVLASRKVIPATWVNQKDEFLAPDFQSKEDQEKMERKSVIYSIFSPANNIISYREDYKGAQSVNLNEWFFMDVEKIKDLANEYNNDSIYNDAIEYANTPAVLQYLRNAKLDDKDKKILEIAQKLVVNTFKFRNIVNDDNPDYSVNTWDASWNQILQVAKLYTPDEIKKFNIVFNNYSKDIIDLVYTNKILLRGQSNDE